MVLQQLERGVYTAIVTPHTDNYDVDMDRLRTHVQGQLEAGVAGIVLGTTSGMKFYDDPFDASLPVYAAVVDALRKTIDESGYGVPLIIGIDGTTSAESLHRAKIAADNGADVGLCVTPAYVKSRQNGLERFFERVAQGPLPLLLYDVQGRTGVSIEPDTLQTLARNPRILGIKAATTDRRKMAGYVSLTRPKFTEERDHPFRVFSGDDATAPDVIYHADVDGVVAVVSNIAPQRWIEVIDHYLSKEQGCHTNHVLMVELSRLSMAYGNPMTTHAILDYLGRSVGPVASDELGRLTETELARLHHRLDAIREDIVLQ